MNNQTSVSDIFRRALEIRQANPNSSYKDLKSQIISEFGYGLAMYLCKHEVEAMNGRIWFDSAEGIGTTLSIALPVSSSSSGKP